ncbi:hypothetical protein SBOR_0921 [Sclerotinia borealis F-4128]|uniref:Homeobox domain-containing protein n=1 Tax=Sclerotinia borealis (strain F-4128) TaxID=1432307 RepID=W9CRG8_SCLBF|nr:hypothetical protein SBOR_0921 [Sclerotinia borealis F-4128]
MEPKLKRVGGPVWKSGELAKMKEIIRGLEGKTDRYRGNFWQKVSSEMKVHGFDRQPAAICAKWRRATNNFQSKSPTGNASSIWDVSDSDGAEDEEDEEYFKSNFVHGRELKDEALKPWTAGNNWLEEEDTIAFDCIKSQRDRERELKVEPVSAEQIWHMVSDSLASHGFYRKAPNVYRYWNTKGREKHNFDARSPSAIEKAMVDATRVPGIQPKQAPSKPATLQDRPSRSISKVSTKNPSQLDNPNAEITLGNAQLSDISPQQHAILKVQYAKYNQLDNPVVNELALETGLNREQIKIWYRTQRSIDLKLELQKEAEVQTGKEPSRLFLDKSELESIGSRRHRVSDIGFQSQVDENPAKRLCHSLGSEGVMDNRKKASVDMNAQNEAFDYQSTISGLMGAPSNNGRAASTIEVQQPSFKPATQSDIPDPASQMNVVLTAERQRVRQKMLAAEAEHRKLKLAIVAHKERAEAELEAARAKVQELTVQEEILEKASERIVHIEVLIDDQYQVPLRR